MSHARFWSLILFFALASSAWAQTDLSVQAGAKESFTTADFSRVVDKTKELLKRYSKEDVLVVVDVDNTLLAMNQDLGSDQWFNWQTGLLQDEPNSPDLVAADMGGLLGVQGTLFSLSKMHPPEPKLPEHISTIQQLGLTTVVLTSRGYGFRDATERELKRNGYELASTAPRIEEVRGLFKPFDPDRPDAHGLSQVIIDEIKGSLRTVTYSNGIYMTAGQHKGYMLRTLLARMEPKKDYKAIVFVDDHEKHTTRMHAAFDGSPIQLATFHYTREAGNVSNFDSSQKRHVVEDWQRLEDFVESVLVQ